MKANFFRKTWRDIMLIQEVKCRGGCQLWLKGAKTINVNREFDAILEDMTGFFACNLEKNIQKFKHLYGEQLPILPIYRDFILISLTGKKHSFYLVKDHCVLYRGIKNKEGWSEIFLSDTRKIKVPHGVYQIKKLFQCGEQIKKRMPLIYLLDKGNNHFKEKKMAYFTNDGMTL